MAVVDLIRFVIFICFLATFLIVVLGLYFRR